MSDLYVHVRELPDALQWALQALNYCAHDVRIETSERFSSPVSGDGSKAFVCLVNLATGERRTLWGSWGGSNMFTRDNPVDNFEGESSEIPPGFAAITGSTSTKGASPYLKIELRPDAIVPWLPAKAEVSARERWILGCFAGLKPAYRKEEFARRSDFHTGGERIRKPVAPAEIDSLVTRGFLKRNAAGATQITTLGKNNAGTGLRRPDYAE